MNQARAILWAQWRTWRNSFRLGRIGGAGWTALISSVWYGLWTLAALAVARLASSPENLTFLRSFLPGGLFLMFLYWQVVPLLMAATGASLELRKLLVYPIPSSDLFAIEVMLRVTGAVEMLLVTTGLAGGILLNPALPKSGVSALAEYVLFNLFLAAGLNGLITRLLAHKQIREIAFLLVVICAGLPQLLLMRSPLSGSRLRALLSNDAWRAWPWGAAAQLAGGTGRAESIAAILGWTVLAGLFGYWQFSRTLRFDAQAAAATPMRGGDRTRFLERLYRLPSILFRDPTAALVEKEIRFLARSPRFRLVFLMGFTFGLVIWLPTALGRSGASRGFLSANYLTVVSVYSLLLLSEVCFWNSFGFDRSAAQIYFLSPVPFWRVLVGKNLSAVFFILAEILIITTVCAFLGMPLEPARLAEAYSVAGVITIFLLAAGNLLSIHHARGVNPSNSFRRGAAGPVQAMLFLIYPIAFLPAALAYLARWAFGTELAFFAVLMFDAIVGVIVYRIALDSAAAAAERLKESMITSLSAGDGPITG